MTLEEIDSINCHPTGVQHLCSKYGYIEKKETHLEIYELPHWDFRLERTEGKYYNYIYKIIYLERTSNNTNSEYDMQCFGTLRWGLKATVVNTIS